MVLLSRDLSSATNLLYIPKQLLLLQQKLPQTSIPTFQTPKQSKLLQNQLIYTLDSCKNVYQIKQVHTQILQKGLNQCCYVLTKLIRMLIKFDVPMCSYPRLVLEQVEYPNPFIWNAVIRGYTLQGLYNESISLYNRMRMDGTRPVSFTFSALFKACSAILDVDLGRQIHAQTILIGGFGSDLYVGNTMIDMYLKCGYLDCGRKVFDEMPERDEISWTELIVAYAKSGDMDSAGKLFDGLPSKDMVAWTAMVTGFSQNAKPKEALEIFEKMQEMGVETDAVTLVGVISACAQLGAVKYADWVQDVAEKSGFGSTHNVVIGSALIDMYSKCGCVDNAYNVFEGMKEKNVFSYSSMILGFAMHGRPHAALNMFHKMIQSETKPNKVTFIGVLTACSHAGMVEQGRQIFASMQKHFGVTPSADHYTCMVDLLGRAGRLEEALQLVDTIPVQPHGGVWGALLGACRIHGNPDVAQIAANHLFELEPDGIGNYILLSNVYATAGRWDEVSRVRKLMRMKGLKKNPGCSWMELEKGVIHEFFAGDTTHPMFSAIKQALEDLLERLKTVGYVPNLTSVPYDLSDEEKKLILMTHSEKLALAFGLLSTGAGCVIRIVKNLRICEDCHLVMCGASQITGREIIVRDNRRFHHFSNGICSCGNFW